MLAFLLTALASQQHRLLCIWQSLWRSPLHRHKHACPSPPQTCIVHLKIPLQLVGANKILLKLNHHLSAGILQEDSRI